MAKTSESLRSTRIKKKLAIVVTAALLALPLGTTLVLAETVPVETTSTNTTTDTGSTDPAPDATNADTTTTNTTGPDTADTDSTSTDTTDTDTDTNTDTDTTSPDSESTDTTNTDNEDENNEDTDTTTVVDADGNEVDPANWLSELIGKLKMALAFDPARKGELSEQQALEKLARAQKLMVEGKIEESQVAFSEYTNKITKAQEFLDQIEDPDSEEAQNLTTALANVNHNNIKVLGNLLDKLPPQAAQKLALNVVRSMEKAVIKMEKQEAKNDKVTSPETTSEGTSETTLSTENKALKKQAREALNEFKKSLKQKGKIQLDDDQDQVDEDKKENNVATTQKQFFADGQPTSVTVAPAELESKQMTDRLSKQENRDQDKRDEKSKDQDKDKNQNNQRNKHQNSQRDN
ncbi:MAG: hypothetical protein HGJ98_07375 [Desulfosporosinus sp.]|nr:hypothetical protein [Desulfosporosinus sp.]MBC2726289.1 hypothetical protein [Desulfosporosinus sp.]